MMAGLQNVRQEWDLGSKMTPKTLTLSCCGNILPHVRSFKLKKPLMVLWAGWSSRVMNIQNWEV